jgi:hypothetical protein
MDPTISVSFRLSQTDYVRAMRAHYATRLRLRLDVAVALLVAIGGAYLWQSGNSRLMGMALFSVAVLFALVLLSAFTVIPVLAFRREPKFRDEYSLTFSPGGIQFRTSKINSDIQWALYSWALIDAQSFVLYYGKESFTIVPKRVFDSSSQRDAFEKLLAENIPRIVNK